MNNIVWLSAVLLVAVAGCGKQDGSVAIQAGSTVGETVIDFASGVGKGVDKKMIVNVELSKPLVEAGISKTVAKSAGIGHPVTTKGISVYLLASKPLKSKLMAKAFAKDGQEIGRSIVDLDFAVDDAKYVTFAFDSEMDSQLVDKYIIDVKK